MYLCSPYMPSLMCRYNIIFFYLENSLNLEYVENKSRVLLSGCLTVIYTSIQDKLVNKMTRNLELLKSKLLAVFAT